jgi:hypothetical protein
MIKSKRMRACRRHGEKRNACRIDVGKPERTRQLERSNYGWENNIKMGFRELGWDSMGSINLAQNRDQSRVLLNTVMNLHVP